MGAGHDDPDGLEKAWGADSRPVYLDDQMRFEPSSRPPALAQKGFTVAALQILERASAGISDGGAGSNYRCRLMVGRSFGNNKSTSRQSVPSDWVARRGGAAPQDVDLQAREAC